MIKAIISDYDGVLIPDEYRGARSFCPDVVLLEAVEGKYYSSSDCSKFWDEIRTCVGCTWSNEALITAYNAEDEEQRLHEARVLSLYRSLKPRLTGLFLLSNQIADRANVLRQKTDLSIFDQMYFSNEMQLQKPDPKIFQTVLKEQGLRPEETLFIDDAEENTDAAKGLGMQTILCKDIDSMNQINQFLEN